MLESKVQHEALSILVVPGASPQCRFYSLIRVSDGFRFCPTNNVKVAFGMANLYNKVFRQKLLPPVKQHVRI